MVSWSDNLLSCFGNSINYFSFGRAGEQPCSPIAAKKDTLKYTKEGGDTRKTAPTYEAA